MNVAHFYHCYAAGRWQQPVAEHFDALGESEFPGPVYVGLVGSPTQRRQALAEIRRRRPVAVAAQADRGFEQVTIHALHRYAKRHAGAVLYAHTKGSSHREAGDDPWDDPDTRVVYPMVPRGEDWRLTMTDRVARDWRKCLRLIETGYDTVGAFWGGGIFLGNFWMASCDYLRTLPTCSTSQREDAEDWIGLGKPRQYELPTSVLDDPRSMMAGLCNLLRIRSLLGPL